MQHTCCNVVCIVMYFIRLRK